MKDRLPPVTIGIPFFNAEKTLLDAVRSVFAQTHQDWELILLDDGSTDRSLELAHSIDDPRVRLYSDGQNKRLAARLNQLAQLACHDFVARMDADDMMRRDRIERQLGVLTSSDDVDLVSAGVVSMSDAWTPLGVRCVDENHCISPNAVLAGRSGIVHAAILGRRGWFLRNPYDENLKVSEDTNLWIRSYSKSDLKICVLPDLLYYYREDGNVTPSKLKAAYRELRGTLLSNADAFPLRVRAYAYAVTCIKSAIVTVLSMLGRLDILRARRNALPVTEAIRAQVIDEVAAIRALDLPLTRDSEILDAN